MKDSPVKLNFNLENKENMPSTVEIAAKAEPAVEKPIITEVNVPVEGVKVAKTIKELEAEEPILQENPHRFVLFPIKYHEIVSRLCGRVRVRPGT